ncbi:WD40 repeat protein [Giardia muris]|uniref:WD40 repeat protein n=1 Tax=Giardia muris TaxID=5742 RepID=A0A4Z1T480_GIAMU|nr:WD40 repeat protein [Giardia muris]|eukprot:TNJ28793.1 WD40 repeat protein [Giardia muris]
MDYQDLNIDQQDPVPSAELCLDGIMRHIQAYEKTVTALEQENRVLREQLAILTQQLEQHKQQQVQGVTGIPHGAHNPIIADIPAGKHGHPGGGLGMAGGAYGAGDQKTALPVRASPSSSRRPQPMQLVYLRTHQMHSRAISSLTWLQEFFVTASRDGSARIWYVPREQSDSSRMGSLVTYRTATPLTAVKNVGNHYLLFASTAADVTVHSMSLAAVASTTVYGEIDSLNATLIRTKDGEKSIRLPSTVWSFVELDNQAFCVGAGFAALLELTPEACGVSRLIQLHEPFGQGGVGGRRDEPLLCSFVVRMGGSVFAAVRERYLRGDDLLPANYVPELGELQGYKRSGLRLVRINPDAGASNVHLISYPSVPACSQPLHVTGLSAFGTTHLLATTLASELRIVSLRADESMLRPVATPDFVEGDLITALAVCETYIILGTGAPVNAHPRLYVYGGTATDKAVELRTLGVISLEHVYGAITALGARRVEDGLIIVICGADGEITITCYGL